MTAKRNYLFILCDHALDCWFIQSDHALDCWFIMSDHALKVWHYVAKKMFLYPHIHGEISKKLSHFIQSELGKIFLDDTINSFQLSIPNFKSRVVMLHYLKRICHA